MELIKNRNKKPKTIYLKPKGSDKKKDKKKDLKKDSDEAKKKLEAAGAKVELK